MILTGEDVRLNYFVAGEGPPVTLLHGFTQSGRSWRELIDLMPARWTWIVPTLRGHGETELEPGAPCSMDACADDLELLWKHLRVAKTHLVGYSMGGRLALHVAARRPERLMSLLTIGSHAGLDDRGRAARARSDEALAKTIEADGVEAFVDHWSSLPLFAGLRRRGDAYVVQVRAERLGNRAAGLACSLRGMGAGVMEPVWDGLRRVTAPCTFVAGALDEPYVAAARRLAATVRSGRVEVVQDAGHAVHQEQPDAFARVLTAHLTPATAASLSSPSSTRD